jgi:hypothetical protein
VELDIPRVRQQLLAVQVAAANIRVILLAQPELLVKVIQEAPHQEQAVILAVVVVARLKPELQEADLAILHRLEAKAATEVLAP